MQVRILLPATKQRRKIMELKEHKERHILLHKQFDELLADFIDHTGNLPSKTTTMALMKWSYKQTQMPDEKE